MYNYCKFLYTYCCKCLYLQVIITARHNQIQLFYSTGVSDLILEHPQLLQGAVYSNPEVPVYRKNTGKNRSLRKWSRGHQFIVRVGGHIDTWRSLFRYMYHCKVTINFNTCHSYIIQHHIYSHHNSKFSY